MTVTSNDPESAQSRGTNPKQGASELAATRIRQGIVEGEFRPGDHLSERELCDVTGVSRTAVREALRTLESEGLINVIKYRGPIVAQLTKKEAEDLYDMRALLEGHCTALFTKRASDALLAQLGDTVRDIGQGHADADMEGVIEASKRFYSILFEGADNGAVTKALEALHNRMALFRFSSTRWPGRAERSMEELHDIIRAVQSRDESAASRAAQFHVHQAAEISLLIIAEHERAIDMNRAATGRKR